MGNRCTQYPLIFDHLPKSTVIFFQLPTHPFKFPAQHPHLVLVLISHMKIQIFLRNHL